jgi:N utilization substance protein B
MNIPQNTVTDSNKKIFTRRRNARILAVQCFFSIALTPEKKKTVDEVINDILIYAQGEKLDFDQDYFINLIKETYKNINILHQDIQEQLLANWKVSRLSEPIQAILSLATCEIKYNSSLPEKILINEYIEITKIFNHEGQSGFVNKVLDSIYQKFARQD